MLLYILNKIIYLNTGLEYLYKISKAGYTSHTKLKKLVKSSNFSLVKCNFLLLELNFNDVHDESIIVFQNNNINCKLNR